MSFYTKAVSAGLAQGTRAVSAHCCGGYTEPVPAEK